MLEYQMGRLFILQEAQYGMDMAILRFFRQQSIYLVRNMVMSQFLLLGSQVVLEMEILKVIYLQILLVHDMELWEVLIMSSQMYRFLEIFRGQHWESHLAKNMNLRGFIMVEYFQMGVLQSKLRSIQGYLIRVHRVQGCSWQQDHSLLARMR